jgi:fermentation-respiration switch protein FrsA (DUF1100 family)
MAGDGGDPSALTGGDGERFMRGRWVWALILPALAYLIVACGLYGLQRRLVFQPWTGGHVGPAEAVGMTPVTTVAADGVAVTHWYAPPRHGHAVVVLFHGNGGTVFDLDPWAAAFRARGYGVVLADYRGYSGNPGSPSEAGLYADARALLAWLAAQGFAARSLVLLGWSLGSGVAVQMAVERHPAALVLLAPYTSLVDAAARHYPIFPVRWLLRDRFDNLSKIATVDAPVMIVSGGSDGIVPPDQGPSLLAAAQEPKRGLLLRQVGHIIAPSDAFAPVAAFLEEEAKAAAPPP